MNKVKLEYEVFGPRIIMKLGFNDILEKEINYQMKNGDTSAITNLANKTVRLLYDEFDNNRNKIQKLIKEHNICFADIFATSDLEVGFLFGVAINLNEVGNFVVIMCHAFNEISIPDKYKYDLKYLNILINMSTTNMFINTVDKINGEVDKEKSEMLFIGIDEAGRINSYEKVSMAEESKNSFNYIEFGDKLIILFNNNRFFNDNTHIPISFLEKSYEDNKNELLHYIGFLAYDIAVNKNHLAKKIKEIHFFYENKSNNHKSFAAVANYEVFSKFKLELEDYGLDSNRIMYHFHTANNFNDYNTSILADLDFSKEGKIYSSTDKRAISYKLADDESGNLVDIRIS